jgi:signal transduction histidine kinase
MTETPFSTNNDGYKQLILRSQELTSILNKDTLLEHIIDAAIDLSHATVACIYMFDQNIQELHLETICCEYNTLNRGLIAPIATSLEGRVMTNLQPVTIINHKTYANQFGKITSLTGVDINSLIAVPLTVKDRRIGILEVVNKQSGEFQQADQDILVLFARQASICIENTRLFIQSDLMAELVHELRTPLASLNTALQLLQRADLPENKRQQISGMIQTEFFRLADLTTSFLDYARLESGRIKFQPVSMDVSQLLSESVAVMQMQADSKGIKINIDLPQEPQILVVDRDKIKQVIYNLLNNAIKYSHVGGKIQITVRRVVDDFSFSIQDSGPGIPADSFSKLFERYYRVPSMEYISTGYGLGLSICKQIVEAHGGRIEVASEVGKGSIFTVHLPVPQG